MSVLREKMVQVMPSMKLFVVAVLVVVFALPTAHNAFALNGTTTQVAVDIMDTWLVSAGNTKTLTAVVTDATLSAFSPTGTVVWDDGEAGGTFDPPGSSVRFGSCALVPIWGSDDAASCSVTYSAPSTPGSVIVTANYGGDDKHEASYGSGTLTVLTAGRADQIQEQGNAFQIIRDASPAGQEFVPSRSRVTGVAVRIRADSTARSGLTVSIRAFIDGAILASASRRVEAGFDGWLRFDLATAVAVTPGATYVIQLEAARGVLWCYNDADAYPLGRAIVNGNADSARDWTFRTYADPPETPAPVGGTVYDVDRAAPLSPWLMVISLLCCVTTAVVVANKRHA